MLIWKNIQTRPGSGTNPIPEWLAAAMEQLRRLPADRQKPAVLFSLCGRTPDHVERVFRGCYGMTPGSFLRGRRLRRAAERIVFSTDKIAVIAASCGFENPGYFHRDLMVTSFDVRHGKPDPEPYLMGLQRAGVQPWEALVVENAPLGVRSGVAAGVFTVAVNTGPIPPKVLADEGADLVLPSMAALDAAWDELHATLV